MTALVFDGVLEKYGALMRFFVADTRRRIERGRFLEKLRQFFELLYVQLLGKSHPFRTHAFRIVTVILFELDKIVDHLGILKNRPELRIPLLFFCWSFLSGALRKHLSQVVV